MFSNLKERLIYFFYEVEEDWQIGIARQSINSFISDNKLPEVEWLHKSRDVFQADPFGICVGENYYMFYEEFDKKKGYGYIKCRAFNKNLNVIRDEVVIDEGLHFSFPLIIEHNDCYYMLPETIAKNKLCIYKAVDNDLYKWAEYKTLLHEPCMDSVLFWYNDMWWLFYSKCISNGNDMFFIRCSDNIFGDWESCVELEVANGSYNSRAAGNLFIHENMLLRPAQNCTTKYGESVVLNRIDNLSLSNYREIQLRELRMPKPYTLAFHTLTGVGNITFVDGKRRKLYPKSVKGIVQNVINKLSSGR